MKAKAVIQRLRVVVESSCGRNRLLLYVTSVDFEMRLIFDTSTKLCKYSFRYIEPDQVEDGNGLQLSKKDGTEVAPWMGGPFEMPNA